MSQKVRMTLTTVSSGYYQVTFMLVFYDVLVHFYLFCFEIKLSFIGVPIRKYHLSLSIIQQMAGYLTVSRINFRITSRHWASVEFETTRSFACSYILASSGLQMYSSSHSVVCFDLIKCFTDNLDT